MKEVFDKVDTNHDSRLDLPEFVTFAKSYDVIDFLASKKLLLELDTKFGPAFVNSLGMIFATEIGDKTFFIAAIMAMKYPRSVVFGGAIGALIVMTVLSTIIGHALPHLLPKALTHWASIILFIYFGGRMLYDAYEMYRDDTGKGVSDEMAEVEEELAEKGLAGGDEEKGELVAKETAVDLVGASQDDIEMQGLNEANAATSPATAVVDAHKEPMSPLAKVEQATREAKEVMQTHWQILLQAFTLTFLAEWGDRSQIATIALAAAQNPYGVTLGACIGHAVCTGGAVVGGKILATSITERQISLTGGVLFFIFAFYSILMGPDTDI